MHRRSLLIHLPTELGEESEFSLIWCCSAGGRPRSTLALIWRSLRRQRPERCNRLLKLTRFIAEPRCACLCVRGCRCVSVWDKRRKKDERGEKGEWAASVNTAGYPLWKSGSWFFFTEENILTQTHELYCGWKTHKRSASHSWSFFVVVGVSRKNVTERVWLAAAVLRWRLFQDKDVMMMNLNSRVLTSAHVSMQTASCLRWRSWGCCYCSM